MSDILLFRHLPASHSMLSPGVGSIGCMRGGSFNCIKDISSIICKYLSAFHLTFFTVCCARSLSLFLISVSFPLYKCHEHAETEDVDALIYTLYAHLRPHISFCTHLVRKLFAHYTVDSECDWEWVEHGPKSIHLVNMHIYAHTLAYNHNLRYRHPI